MKKLFLILSLFVTSLCVSQSFENGILTIGDLQIKEGDKVKVGTRSDSNQFKYFAMGPTKPKLIKIGAPVAVWQNNVGEVQKIKYVKRKDVYELKIKPGGIGAAVNRLWVFDAVKAIEEGELIFDFE